VLGENRKFTLNGKEQTAVNSTPAKSTDDSGDEPTSSSFPIRYKQTGDTKESKSPTLKFVGLRKGWIPEFESSLLDGQGAVTPGPFIIYPTGGSSNPYYNKHEPGHVIQFYLLGPIQYYKFIAIPSLISSGFGTAEQHSKMPWETSADFLWSLFK
jgi:hypothetical protein